MMFFLEGRWLSEVVLIWDPALNWGFTVCYLQKCREISGTTLEHTRTHMFTFIFRVPVKQLSTTQSAYIVSPRTKQTGKSGTTNRRIKYTWNGTTSIINVSTSVLKQAWRKRSGILGEIWDCHPRGRHSWILMLLPGILWVGVRWGSRVRMVSSIIWGKCI